MPYLIIAAAFLGVFGIALLALILLRKNTTVYRATGNGNEFANCGRIYMNPAQALIQIDRVKAITGGVVAFEINDKTAPKLFGRTIRVSFHGQTFEHEVGEIKGSYWFKIDVGYAPEKETAPKTNISRGDSGLKSILKNRMVVGAMCLVLAAIISFGLLPRLYKDRSATTEIVRLRQNIEYGTTVTDDMLITVEVGSYGLPEQVIRANSDIVGLVAGGTVYAGENLWRECFITEDEYRANERLLDYDLTGGMCLVTISLPSDSAGIAGYLRPGDIVDVYNCRESSEIDGISQVSEALASVKVCNVLNEDLQSLDIVEEQWEQDTEGQWSDYDFAPAYVVFYVNDAQAQILMSLERDNALHLTLRGEAK
jgi:pilus assembly protein CpaB